MSHTSQWRISSSTIPTTTCDLRLMQGSECPTQMIASLGSIVTSLSHLDLDTIADSHVHALIASAHRTLKACMQHINAHSPILRLPRDVLVLVFRMVLEVTEPFRERPTWQLPPAVALSHVCVAWRSTALSDPLLWTRIERVKTWNINTISAYLHRSQACPLDIELQAIFFEEYDDRFDDVDPAVLCSDVIKLGRILGRELMRCRRLSIQFDDLFKEQVRGLVQGMESASSLPLSRLRELRFEASKHPYVLDISNILSRITPEFTTLKLAGVPFVPPAVWGSDQITSLHLDLHLRPDVFLAIIHHFHFLDTLVLHEYCESELNFDGYSPLVLPSLRCLALLGFRRVSEFLLSISAPHLRNLTIAPCLTGDLTISRESSNCAEPYRSVRELTLAFPATFGWGAQVRSESLTLQKELFLSSQCFPEVEVITAVGEERHVLLDTLVMTSQSGKHAFPKLHTLAVKTPLSAVVLQELVAWRNQAGSPLRTIYMDGVPPHLHESDFLIGCVDLEIVNWDSWDEFWRTLLYYPFKSYGSFEHSLKTSP